MGFFSRKEFLEQTVWAKYKIHMFAHNSSQVFRCKNSDFSSLLQSRRGKQKHFCRTGYFSDLRRKSFLLENGLGFCSWVKRFCARCCASVTVLMQQERVLCFSQPSCLNNGAGTDSSNLARCLLWDFVNILKLAKSLNFCIVVFTWLCWWSFVVLHCDRREAALLSEDWAIEMLLNTVVGIISM